MKTLHVLCFLVLITAIMAQRIRPAKGKPDKTFDPTQFIGSLMNYVDDLQSYIAELKAERTAGSIAFHAVRTVDLGPVAQDTVITYDDIVVDVGNHFQSSTAFHVPLDGLYYFSYKYNGSDTIVNVMLKPDEPTAGAVVESSAVGTGNIDSNSGGSIVMDLVVGNQVYLELPAGAGTNTIKSDPVSRSISFCGFILYQKV